MNEQSHKEQARVLHIVGSYVTRCLKSLVVIADNKT